jgi:hypothetical protein
MNTYYNFSIERGQNGTYMIKVIAFTHCGLMNQDVSGSFNITYEDTSEPSDPVITVPFSPLVGIGISGILCLVAIVIVLKRKGRL